MRILCFSSFTFSYLDRARVLFKSLKKYHPDWHLVALITDRPPLELQWDPAGENFDELTYVDELGIDPFYSWLFKHDIVEACTAVKGPFVYQSCHKNFDVVIYLDPDTCVFNSLNPVLSLLEDYDIVLTPHLIAPESDFSAIMDNEISALRAGIYNLGFVAIRTVGDGFRFARWWNDRLLKFCYDDVPTGLFVDQRWCDHVPALFDRVMVLRDPGYNVASWNLSQRRVTITQDGMFRINGIPLRFWHFTKLGPVGDTMTKRYAKDNFEVFEIWNWYKREIAEAKAFGVPLKYWAFANFDDGRPIEKRFRELYRADTALQTKFENPFRSGEGTFQAWLDSEGLCEASTG